MTNVHDLHIHRAFHIISFLWWGAGVVISLRRSANLHMAQLMLLSLASVKSRLVLVPAHPGNAGQSPEGRKTDVCVFVF